MPVTVDLEKCIGSRDCLKACAFNALDVIDGKCVIYENCVDCDECVRACPTHAIASATAAPASTGGLLVVDFGERSGIIAPIERATRRAGLSNAAARVDAADASAVADALAADLKQHDYRIVALPHAGAGPAVSARLAAKLDAALLAGCEEIAFDDAGGVRATRLRYGGLVRVSSRVPAGRTIVTIVPRGVAAFPAAPLEDVGQAGESVGEAPHAPALDARSIVAVAVDAPPATLEAAHRIAESIGASVVDPAALPGKNLKPELFIAVGVDGSTELNAAIRGAGTVVALVKDATAPIMQSADLILVGDVSEHARALVSAL